MQLLRVSVALAVLILPASADTSFSFTPHLLGPAATLALSVTSVDRTTGAVVVNGVDTRAPTAPFAWDWGDGSTTTGWFPQTKAYRDTSRNYVVRVTSNYVGGGTAAATVVIRFVDYRIAQVPLSANVAVSAPTTMVNLGTRLYPLPSNLAPLEGRDFGATARSTVEYVLTAAASIQKDFVNDNVFLIDGKFAQLVYKDPTFNGMYALWFTNPVVFAVGPAMLTDSLSWSSFFHEMGHNFTLNTPGSFYYGGRIDGNANALFSESMAQIFQHATARELAVNANLYGLDDVLVLDIENSAVLSIQVLRASYERYVSSGKRFSSWNDSGTPQDETFDTFMTVAYTFLKHAETDNMGYRAPLKRMLEFLQLFNSAWQQQYGQSRNDASSEAFRATLMTAALSNAFQRDMRDELRGLNFPIDNAVYASLSDGGGAAFTFAPSSVVLGPEGSTGTIEVTTAAIDATWVARSDQNWLTITAGSAGRGPRTLRYSVAANTSAQNRTATIRIGTASLAVTQLAVSRPAALQVANAWSELPLIADAGWIYVKGANLASTTRTWRQDEIIDGKLPTSLDGVSVKINNLDASVYYISPTQINLQVPGDGASGPVAIQVTTPNGTSDPMMVNKQPIAPAVFVWPQGVATEANKFVGAVATEGQQIIYIGKSGLLQPVGLPTRPARPNEVVLLFATGCGPTDPPFPAGRVVTTPVPHLASPVSVKVGGQSAEVAANTGFLIFAGECQFNVTVPPSAPDGDLLLELEIGGVKAQTNIYITVKR